MIKSKSSSLATSILRGNWLVFVIFAVALGLRLYRLGMKPFWQDEGVTWYIGNGILSSDAHPAFYFFLLEKFLPAFGNNEFAGRLLSALCGALTVLAIYYLARLIFNHKAAIFAALFVAVSPYAIAMSQEMRMYALVGFEFVLLLIAFCKILPAEQSFKKAYPWWILLFLAGLAGLNTHAVLNFQLVFLTILFVLVVWRQAPKRLLNWGILLLLWATTYLPSFLHMSAVAGSRKHVWVTPEWMPLYHNISFLFKSWFLMIIGDPFEIYIMPLRFLPSYKLFLLLATFVILFIIGVVIFVHYLRTTPNRKTSNEWRYLKGLLLLSLMNLSLFLVLETSSPNHLITLFIPMVLLTAFLWMRIGRIIKVISFVAIFTVLILGSIQYYRAPNHYFDGVTWSTVGHFLCDQCEEDEVFIVFGNRNIFYTIKYYADDLPCEMYYITTSKWEKDPYQIEPDFASSLNPVPLVEEYLEKYPRLWLLMNRMWMKELIDAPDLNVEMNRFKRPADHLLVITKKSEEEQKP